MVQLFFHFVVFVFFFFLLINHFTAVTNWLTFASEVFNADVLQHGCSYVTCIISGASSDYEIKVT